MNKKTVIILYLFLLSFQCSPTSTSFSATGYVIEKGTNQPIDSALISLSCKGRNSSSMTNSKGYFKIGISIYPDSSEAAVLNIQKIGYNSVSQTIYSIFGQANPDTFYLQKT